MIKQLVVATSLLMCSGVFAKDSNWLLLTTGDGFKQFVSLDKNTKVAGSTTKETQVWTKILMTKETPEGDRVGDYTLVQQQIRCSDKNSKILQAIGYSNTGKVLESEVVKDPKYAGVIPDSVDEGLVKVVCG